MKRSSISPGVYVSNDASGAATYWARPTVRGRRTWKKLAAVKPAAAVKEYIGKDWTGSTGSLAELAQLYVAAGCPNKRLEERPVDFLTAETARVTNLVKFFGPLPAATIRIHDLPRYRAWRIKHIRFGEGDRTVDKDVQTLSNLLNYGVATGTLEFNFIRAGRPRFQRASAVRHARDVAPPDASTIHKIADFFFDSVRSEVHGWISLFAMFNGCRISETLRLRLDAKTDQQAGFIQWQNGPDGKAIDGRLSLERSKDGVNEFAIIGPDFAAMIDCFHRWHAARFPNSPWYFPSPFAKLSKGRQYLTADEKHGTVDIGAFGHALVRATKELNLPHITPHGYRSYYVTKRRSDGEPDTVIAGEIGDVTVTLMQTTYGKRPKNWTGGEKLTWRPAEGLPAWSRWASAESKVVSL